MKRLEWKNDQLVEGGAPLTDALLIDNDADLAAHPVALEGVDAVALVFPKLRDGRAFTQARILRRQGFTGDICARGTLFRDQVLFALRCGFTSFELDKDYDVDGLLQSIRVYPAFYQRAIIGGPVWEARK
ncbi:DUF934 domain-containing protein [Parvularcula sp. LCG005]|uniref:DUF934 domain-containing protein n=1 Tax=Parvularcula sp. LCG005 TaxID=3078805 RepID=UPI0029420F6A|nr:DUF934 domain-containing protein [Parvularcula sp. LCG005]WOI53132.1 DUF934 domain-containing protein [Parvularcula sp. LCG005]